MEEENSDFQYKILLLGPSGAGKTSLLLKYSDNIFENVAPTVGVDVRYKYITYENKKIKLDIWDTAGQERYNSVTNSCLNGTNAIIFVYDMTKKASFEKLKTWINNNIDKIEDMVKMVVENKIDIKEEREVSQEDINNFKKDYNIKEVYSTSAKTGDGINEMFMELIKQLLNNKNFGKINPEDESEKSNNISISNINDNNDTSNICPC